MVQDKFHSVSLSQAYLIFKFKITNDKTTVKDNNWGTSINDGRF